MIYLDTSVVLARLLAEDRSPPDALWAQPLVTSRLLEYEVFNRLHALDAAGSHALAARRLVSRVSLLELSPQVLSRALAPFPSPVRTLDALHLATMDFLRHHGQTLSLATYDQRMAAAAVAMGFALAAV